MKKIAVLLSIASMLPLSSMAASLSCRDFEPSHTAIFTCDVPERNESLCVLKDNDDNRIATGIIKENSFSVTWTFENVENTSKKLLAHDHDWFGLNRYNVKLEISAEGNGYYSEDIIRNDYAGDRTRSRYSAVLRNCRKN